jgi:hypothetical protein
LTFPPKETGVTYAVVSGPYLELFAAIAAASGTLTGLLFVALSVTPSRRARSRSPVIQQIRAAAALQSFTNALAVSLFALVPGTNIGYPAVVLSVIGIAFTAASVRSVMASRATTRQKLRQLELVVLLLLIFGAELIAGIVLLGQPASQAPAQVIGYALIASLLVGVARAWEIVGEVDTGIWNSLATLAGRVHLPDAGNADPDGASEAESEPNIET